MGMRPATLVELEPVRLARAEFRAHWESIRSLFPCAFEGTGDDIDALDYLDYEGLKYPASGFAGAALVWGNVIATQMPFHWFFDEEICGPVLKPQSGGPTIWPFARVYEAQRSPETQYNRYRWLMESVVLQYLSRQILEPRDRPRLLALLGEDDSGLVRALEYAIGQLRELRGGQTGQPKS